jgi:hypothetical protein
VRLSRHAPAAKVAEDGQDDDDDNENPEPGRHAILSVGGHADSTPRRSLSQDGRIASDQVVGRVFDGWSTVSTLEAWTHAGDERDEGWD